MSSATITLTKCSDYSEPKIAEAVHRQFELLGGVGKFVKCGDSVLLKPNFIAPRSRRCATQTDPSIIIETAKLLKDFGARPFVGDSPAWGNVFSCAKALKLDESLKKLDVPIRQLDRPKKCRIRNATVGISSVALNADVIINLPKFKTHQQLVATFAVKNMFGCVSGKKKALWHFIKGKNHDDFCELLIGLFEFLKPALTIIDGIVAMDGPGPIRGRARPLGWLIGGIEPIACEVICCKLVNINPENLPMINTAKKIGVGVSELREIEIVGDEFSEDNICMDFELAELIPLRFSLPRVFKSICKQAGLLIKSAIRKIYPPQADLS